MGATEAVLRVEGAKELRTALKRAGEDIDDFKDAHREVATVIAQAAGSAAPIGPTGRTRASVRPGATLRAAIVRVGSARVPYPAVDHYGWRAKNIKTNKWLIRVAEATEPTWYPIYERHVDQVLKRIEAA